VHAKISTENISFLTRMTFDGSPVDPEEIPDCRVTIASNPASGFGAGITLTSLHTPPGSSFEVYDGDSVLSPLLGAFSTEDSGVVDWPSGTQFAGSTTAGEK
jgi:hypothetical protein